MIWKQNKRFEHERVNMSSIRGGHMGPILQVQVAWGSQSLWTLRNSGALSNTAWESVLTDTRERILVLPSLKALSTKCCKGQSVRYPINPKEETRHCQREETFDPRPYIPSVLETTPKLGIPTSSTREILVSHVVLLYQLLPVFIEKVILINVYQALSMFINCYQLFSMDPGALLQMISFVV